MKYCVISHMTHLANPNYKLILYSRLYARLSPSSPAHSLSGLQHLPAVGARDETTTATRVCFFERHQLHHSTPTTAAHASPHGVPPTTTAPPSHGRGQRRAQHRRPSLARKPQTRNDRQDELGLQCVGDPECRDAHASTDVVTGLYTPEELVRAGHYGGFLREVC